MRGFFAVLRMDLRNTFTNPVLINYNTLFSFLLVLIMGFLGSGAYQNPSDSYFYYTVSFTVFAMLNGAMTATNCFMERDVRRPNLRIIHSPVGSFSVYFSKILAAFLFDTVCHLVILVALIALFRLPMWGCLPYVVLIMLPVEFASSALGVLFCCFFKTEETASTLLSTTISILAFLGGTFFSFDGMGGAFAFISRLSPVKWVNDAFFAVIFDGRYSLVLPFLLGGAVLSALLVLGCKLAFKTEDYLC